MKFERLITAIDSHTEGQFTRMVVSGFPNIPGKTMALKRDYVKQNLDHLRTALLQEPRGGISSFGCVMTAPVTDEAAFGIIWMEAGTGSDNIYIDMCGHGTIGVATTAIEMGLVPVKEPITEIPIDTPAGLVHAKVKVENGRAKSVTLENVPSFLYKTQVITVPNLGELSVDIAFGGNNYAIVEAKDLGIKANTTEIRRAGDLIEQVEQSLKKQVRVQHPEKPFIRGVFAILLNDEPSNAESTVKNVCVHSSGGVFGIDRSPCGTGTSARMAAWYAQGKLQPGETFVSESIMGTVYYGNIAEEVKVGDFKAIVPEITGRAWITGIHHFMIDADDPFKHGFLL